MTHKEYYKLIDPTELPAPADLDETWLERLEVPEALRRHWLHLSPAERALCEAERVVAQDYLERGILTEGKATREALAGSANQRDRAWLRPGKGRAVDFKRCLEVLEIYARYRTWAARFPSSLEVLDLILPYVSKNWEMDMDGEGFLRVHCHMHRPRLGKLGEVQWGTFGMEFNEVNLDQSTENRDRWLNDPDFNPFEIIDPGLRARSPITYATGGERRNRRSWLLDALCRDFRRLADDTNHHGMSRTPIINKDQHPDLPASPCVHNRLQFELPRPEQVQHLMDSIAATQHQVRWPFDAGQTTQQVQLDVEPDLTWITAAIRVREKGFFESYGTFYHDRERAGPLNPPKI